MTQNSSNSIPLRQFGKTDVKISALGMGGHHLGDAPDEQTAVRMVQEACDGGITFFDNCWEYHRGKSEVWMGKGLKGRRDNVFLMTKVCTQRSRGRSCHGNAGAVLEPAADRSSRSLANPWRCFRKRSRPVHSPQWRGRALRKAKEQGKVRFVGFTGHKDPHIHLKMLNVGFPFDSVQMLLNAFDPQFHSFETQVLPELNTRGIAALGMKPISGHGEPVKAGVVSAQEALRYAMSLPVSSTISGVDSMDVLQQNLAVARGFQPMAPADMQALRERCKFLASDGRLELFKVTKKYDGSVGRQQHHFPSSEELPA
jgi:aryl-alcohol dehydrogenase-like predicted oxidoreductase